MQVVLDRGYAGARVARYVVEDVRAGVVVRTLPREGWLLDLPTMEALNAFIRANGAMEVGEHFERLDMLTMRALEDGGEVDSACLLVAQPLRPRGRFALHPALVAALCLVVALLVEVADRLHAIPGF